jgi:hypothetical protein
MNRQHALASGPQGLHNLELFAWIHQEMVRAVVSIGHGVKDLDPITTPITTPAQDAAGFNRGFFASLLEEFVKD